VPQWGPSGKPGRPDKDRKKPPPLSTWRAGGHGNGRDRRRPSRQNGDPPHGRQGPQNALYIPFPRHAGFSWSVAAAGSHSKKTSLAEQHAQERSAALFIRVIHRSVNKKISPVHSRYCQRFSCAAALEYFACILAWVWL